MSVDKIYYEKEEKYIPEEIEATKLFLESFYKESGISFENIFSIYGIADDDYLNQFSFVRFFLTSIQRKHLGVFYDILKASDYDMRTEIQFFCKLIGSSFGKSKREEAIVYTSSSPIIGECYTKDNVVTIESDYGTISFKSIFESFDEEGINKFFDDFEQAGNCHNISWELMSYFDKVNLVTSILRSGFKAQYYHTYLEQNGNIIDAASGITTDLKNYNGIYLPEITSVVSNNYAETEYERVMATHQFDNSSIKPKALRIAIAREMERRL